MVLFAVIDITDQPLLLSGSTVQVKKSMQEKPQEYLLRYSSRSCLPEMDSETIQHRHLLICPCRSARPFVLAVEMTFNIEIFQNDGPEGSATIVPVIFPLIAGAGALATTLTLKAECSVSALLLPLYSICLSYISSYVTSISWNEYWEKAVSTFYGNSSGSSCSPCR